MKNHKWLAGCLALALGGVMVSADLSYAQPRGRGSGCPYATPQAGGAGQGAGNVNCPNYPGYQQKQRQSGNSQGRGLRGPRGSRGAGGSQMGPGGSIPDSNQ